MALQVVHGRSQLCPVHNYILQLFIEREHTQFVCLVQFLKFSWNKVNLNGNNLKKNIQSSGNNILKINSNKNRTLLWTGHNYDHPCTKHCIIALVIQNPGVWLHPGSLKFPFSGIFFHSPFAFEAGLSLKFLAFFGLEPRFFRYLSMSVAREPSIYPVIW